MNGTIDGLIHHALVAGLLESGRMATIDGLSRTLSIERSAVVAGLCGLAGSHGAVLHPHSGEPWVVHPFSGSPGAVWIDGGDRAWWAPCLWCACGVAALADRDVTIHARFGGEAGPAVVHVRNGLIVERDLWVHFSTPPRDAWDNVHHFCATVLPFRGAADVERWSARYGLPIGAVVPLPQVMELGRRWYGRHADSGWRKWSVREAAGIFAETGLAGPFWELPDGNGGF